MGWFPCSGQPKRTSKKKKNDESVESTESTSSKLKDGSKDGSSNKIAAKTFSFREMAVAIRNFRSECLLGEGGFGRVSKDSWGAPAKLLQLSNSIGTAYKEIESFLSKY